jgi:hypothetical protein
LYEALVAVFCVLEGADLMSIVLRRSASFRFTVERACVAFGGLRRAQIRICGDED